ncbi:MAG: hypothetical protein R6V58_17435, partial [Planctomycetota bacterium]
GELCLLEIAARGGGMFISSDIVPLACGVEPEEILLRLHLGERVETPSPTCDRAAGFYCIGPPPGRLLSIEGLDELRALPSVHRVVCDLAEGDIVEEMAHKASRPGVITFSADSRDRLEEALDELKAVLAFRFEVDGAPRTMPLE